VVYTVVVLFLLLHLCRFAFVFGLSVRVSAKEISSPAGYTKQLFDNSTKAIFVLENIFCGQHLIKTFFKAWLLFFFKFEIDVCQSRLKLWPVLPESDDE